MCLQAVELRSSSSCTSAAGACSTLGDTYDAGSRVTDHSGEFMMHGQAESEAPSPKVAVHGRRPRGAGLKGHERHQRVTTLMIRNIPVHVAQQEFVDKLDEAGFPGLYDFVHLPTLLCQKESKGYAFVNFLDPRDANKLRKTWHKAGIFGEHAQLNISFADLQGREAHLERWKASKNQRIKNPKFRPLILPEQAAAKSGLVPQGTSTMASCRDFSSPQMIAQNDQGRHSHRRRGRRSGRRSSGTTSTTTANPAGAVLGTGRPSGAAAVAPGELRQVARHTVPASPMAVIDEDFSHLHRTRSASWPHRTVACCR